jgi:prepilin-type N-terminal cleavage/methylation domain-containing protein
MTKLHQRGDTIVEVLIAITIVSMILGGAYVTSHNSLDATQDAQEHDNALQLAQGQVELLRSDQTPGNAIFTATTPFCLANNGSTATACTTDSTGSTSAIASQNIYKVQVINRTGNNNGPYTFTVQTTWPGLQNRVDQVQLMYRVYE